MPTLTGALPEPPTSGPLTRFTSDLPLRSRRFAFGFLRDALRIRRLLDEMLPDPASGLVAYELRAQPLRNRYTTVSVWTSPEALARFAAHPTHVAVMRRQRDRLGAASFATTDIDASTVRVASGGAAD